MKKYFAYALIMSSITGIAYGMDKNPYPYISQLPKDYRVRETCLQQPTAYDEFDNEKRAGEFCPCLENEIKKFMEDETNNSKEMELPIQTILNNKWPLRSVDMPMDLSPEQQKSWEAAVREVETKHYNRIHNHTYLTVKYFKVLKKEKNLEKYIKLSKNVTEGLEKLKKDLKKERSELSVYS